MESRACHPSTEKAAEGGWAALQEHLLEKKYLTLKATTFQLL